MYDQKAKERTIRYLEKQKQVRFWMNPFLVDQWEKAAKIGGYKSMRSFYIDAIDRLSKEIMEEHKMKKYEIIENTREVKHAEDIKEGCTLDQQDQEPVVLESYDTLDEAKEMLKTYDSFAKDMSGYWLVTEYYIEENDYDEDGEWVSGGDVVEFSPIK